MKNLVKSNEVENKPKNVEDAIKAGWRTAEEIYTTADSSRRTWDNFVADIRNAISQKPNSSCAIDCITKNCITGAHNTKYYHPKVEEAFQAWLMKNQTNQGRASATIKEATMENLEIGAAANYVMSSGSIEAAQQFAQLLISRTEAIAKSKQLEAKNQQLEHALNYTAVIGWKKWSDLKRELAQSFEIFQHRISFKTVAAEAGLVKEIDYAERIFGEDCFPTTMISESGIDKIYDCYDR